MEMNGNIDSKESYSIAELAREFDITSRTIRFYEDQGLINPLRRGQSRIYSKADRVRLAWILRGKSVGFSLADIAEMLDLYVLDDGRARQREVTLLKCENRVKALKAQRKALDATIKELAEFCALLENLETDPATGTLLDRDTGEPATITAHEI